MSDVKTVKFTLNGQAVSAPEGQMLADAAADNGVYIPTLCHTRGQACLGTCRVCAAQVNGKVGASCTLPVAEGMAVETETADVKNMQKTVVELLFAEGNHNCPSCEKSGHCDLQAVGYEVGMFVSRFNYCYTPHESETIVVGARSLYFLSTLCAVCSLCRRQKNIFHQRARTQRAD